MPGIAEDNCPNKRELSRIKTTLSMKMRVVSAEEKTLIESGIGENLRISLKIPQTLSDPALNEWFKFLDAKLDMLLQFIFEDQPTFHMPLVVCNLSGGGMNIISKDKFSPGDTLEIKILYPFSPPQILRLYGEVLRSEERADGHLTALKFTVIDDSVREMIIKLVFEKERELIRRKRGE
jgi:hypothetical protein